MRRQPRFDRGRASATTTPRSLPRTGHYCAATMFTLRTSPRPGYHYAPVAATFRPPLRTGYHHSSAIISSIYFSLFGSMLIRPYLTQRRIGGSSPVVSLQAGQPSNVVQKFFETVGQTRDGKLGNGMTNGRLRRWLQRILLDLTVHAPDRLSHIPSLNT